MRWTLGNVLITSFLSFLSTLSSTALTNPSEVRQAEATVLIYDYADVPSEVLAKAEGRADAIFHEIDVKMLWVDSADFKRQFHSDSQNRQEELDSIDMVLRIVPHSRAALRSSALGEALPCQLGRDACIANVFMNRVGEQTDVEKISLDQVLGHAMAHKIGHILLGSNSHDQSLRLGQAKTGQSDGNELEDQRVCLQSGQCAIGHIGPSRKRGWQNF